MVILEQVTVPMLSIQEGVSMTFYVYKDHAGEWRWYLKAANGRKVADSGEGYTSQQHCLDGITLVKSAFNAPVYEI
jgi:uncharacterized protein YegP (UPF0339 family)